MFSKKFKSAVILSTFAVGVAASGVVSDNTDITSPELEVISNKPGNENLDVTLGGETVASTISDGKVTDTDSDVKEDSEGISTEKLESSDTKEGAKNPESEAAVSAISEGEGTDTDSDVKKDPEGSSIEKLEISDTREGTENTENEAVVSAISDGKVTDTDSDVKEDPEGSSAEKLESSDTKGETESPESKAAGSNGEPNDGYVYVDKQNDEKSQAAGISNKKVGLALGGAALVLTGGAAASGVALYKSKNSGDKPRKEEPEPTEDDPEHLNPAEDDPKKDAKSSGIVGFYKNNPLYLTIPTTAIAGSALLALIFLIVKLIKRNLQVHPQNKNLENKTCQDQQNINQQGTNQKNVDQKDTSQQNTNQQGIGQDANFQSDNITIPNNKNVDKEIVLESVEPKNTGKNDIDNQNSDQRNTDQQDASQQNINQQGTDIAIPDNNNTITSKNANPKGLDSKNVGKENEKLQINVKKSNISKLSSNDIGSNKDKNLAAIKNKALPFFQSFSWSFSIGAYHFIRTLVWVRYCCSINSAFYTVVEPEMLELYYYTKKADNKYLVNEVTERLKAKVEESLKEAAPLEKQFEEVEAKIAQISSKLNAIKKIRKINEEGKKLWKEGKKLWKEGEKLQKEGEKLQKEKKLCAQCKNKQNEIDKIDKQIKLKWDEVSEQKKQKDEILRSLGKTQDQLFNEEKELLENRKQLTHQKDYLDDNIRLLKTWEQFKKEWEKLGEAGQLKEAQRIKKIAKAYISFIEGDNSSDVNGKFSVVGKFRGDDKHKKLEDEMFSAPGEKEFRNDSSFISVVKAASALGARTENYNSMFNNPDNGKAASLPPYFELLNNNSSSAYIELVKTNNKWTVYELYKNSDDKKLKKYSTLLQAHKHEGKYLVSISFTNGNSSYAIQPKYNFNEKGELVPVEWLLLNCHGKSHSTFKSYEKLEEYFGDFSVRDLMGGKVCRYTTEDVIRNTTITGTDGKEHYYYMHEGFKEEDINVKQNSNANILNNSNNSIFSAMQNNSGILSSGS